MAIDTGSTQCGKELGRELVERHATVRRGAIQDASNLGRQRRVLRVKCFERRIELTGDFLNRRAPTRDLVGAECLADLLTVGDRV
jgi:hypothetical protein